MSKRDGHEWYHLPDLGEENCEGKDGQCCELAVWEKSLIACNKDRYFGGFFCNECKEAESE